jgi:hypothetical protein
MLFENVDIFSSTSLIWKLKLEDLDLVNLWDFTDKSLPYFFVASLIFMFYVVGMFRSGLMLGKL